ncbi:hypothetical protein C7I36_16750, partial [Zobellella taiwanensis]
MKKHMSPQQHQALFRRKPLITALEPRILLDGAAVATAVEMTTDVAFQESAAHNAPAEEAVHFDAPAPVQAEPAGQRRELAFVDASVEGYQSLVDGLGDGIEVILLDGNGNGLEQMVAALQGQSGLDAIHVFSHGSVGELTLGSFTLNNSNLAAQEELLSALGESLTESGDLMLYGCYVGANSEGRDFIDAIAGLTGADVAASEDLTGAAGLGGDWTLEVESGVIEAASLAIADYEALLGGSDTNDAPIFGAETSNTQVSVFSYPNLNGTDANPGSGNENANLASIIQWVINQGGDYTLDTSIQNFTDADFAKKLYSSGFFFMTDMESRDPANQDFLPDSAQTTLRNWVDEGGVIMMTGTGGPKDTTFLNNIFGWDLTTQSGSSWSLNTANAAGTPFEGGPASLSNLSATDAIGRGTVEGFTAIYGTDANATVAVIRYGGGTVIFLGYDYYNAGIAGTGFTDTATQYGQDVSNGSQNTNNWVREIIPRALQYSANLSSNKDLFATGDSLTTEGGIIVSDADPADSVMVSVSGVSVTHLGADEAPLATTFTPDQLAAIQAMLSLGEQPVISSGSTTGEVNWTFDSGGEHFGFVGAGETLVLTYQLVADDGKGGVTSRDLVLTVKGINDAPTLSVENAAPMLEVAGDSSTQALESSGVISFNDADIADTVSITHAANNDMVWSGGTLDAGLASALAGGFSIPATTHGASGGVNWSYNLPAVDLDFLAAGETITFSYTVTATDSQGATAEQVVSFTIEGSNDAPVFAPLDPNTQVSVFSYPNLNGTDANPGSGNENANLASIIQWVINQGGDYTLDTSIQNFTDADFADKLNASGFFFMTDMESGNSGSQDFLPDSAQTTLRNWVNDGGVIMMTGTGGPKDTTFLNNIFGWDLTTQGGSSWSLNTANAVGTPFEGGPASLSNLSATDAIGRGTVEGFTAIYGTDDNATVAVIRYGGGTVIFLGYDYYNAGIAGTGFTDTATQYGQDVSNGSQNTNDWVREIIPRALQYSASLASNTELFAGGDTLITEGNVVVSDADQADTVSVSVGGVSVAHLGADEAPLATTFTPDQLAALQAMLSLGEQPVITSGSTTGELDWIFNSGDEHFEFVGAGETLVLTYQLVADDGKGGVTSRDLVLTVKGINDAPTLSVENAAPMLEVAGDSSTQALESSGVISFNDADIADTVSITHAANNDMVWSGGTLDAGLASALAGGFSIPATTHGASGGVNWSYNLPAVDLDFLAAGETITFSYTVTATDSQGATAEQVVSFTIEGSNDAPVFAPLDPNTQVSVFSYPNLNGTDANPGSGNENANLASIIQWVINQGGDYTLDTSIQNFTDADFADKLNASGFFFMTDMESGNPGSQDFLPDSAQTTLRNWVNDGGVIMMTGTGGPKDTTFLNNIFGWDLTTQSGSSWSLNTANAVGTPFEGGPASLSNLSATDAIGRGTVEGFTAIYGTDDNATVAVIRYGGGTVIFLGYDYYNAGIAGTGFTDTATQYGQDVSNGSQNTNDWVREIIPRALQYSASLASNTELFAGGDTLITEGNVVVSDADQADTVSVSVGGVSVAHLGADEAPLATTFTPDQLAALQAMLSLGEQPVITSGSTTGELDWIFNSGDEHFEFVGVGETLVLTYQLVADDGNGGVTSRDLVLTVKGINDAPTLSVEASAPILEVAGDSSAQDLRGTGLVSFGDLDDNDTVSLSVVGNNDMVWSGGSLSPELAAQLLGGFSIPATVNAAAPGGTSWSYAVDNVDLDFLAAGETITFSYTVTATDSQGATASEVVSFTLIGSNDAPTLSVVDAAPILEVAGDSSAQDLRGTGLVSFGDLDDNDTVSLSVVGNNDMVWS